MCTYNKRRYSHAMSAQAHAVEFDVSDDPRLREIVSTTSGGNVVYLTRHGRRVGAVESAEARLARLRAAAQAAKDREEQLVNALLPFRETATDEARGQIDHIIEQLETAADIAAAEASLADPAPSVPLDDLLRENADILDAYPDER